MSISRDSLLRCRRSLAQVDPQQLGTAQLQGKSAVPTQIPPTPAPQIKYEGTPSYIRNSFVPCRMRHFMPDVKIVLMLRDPVDRAVSQYKMNYGTQPVEPDLMSVKVEREINQLREAGCTWQGDDVALGKHYGDCFGCSYEDSGRFCWSHVEGPPPTGLSAELVGKGLYAPQIAWLLHYFPPEQILLINYKDVKTDVFGVAERIARFAGSDAKFDERMLYRGDELRQVFQLGRDYERKMPEHVKADMDKAVKVLERFFTPLNQQLYRLAKDYGLEFGRFENTYDLES